MKNAMKVVGTEIGNVSHILQRKRLVQAIAHSQNHALNRLQVRQSVIVCTLTYPVELLAHFRHMASPVKYAPSLPRLAQYSQPVFESDFAQCLIIIPM